MDATVSVVMTTYSGDNQAELRDCFTSLLKQKRQPDEVIIVRGHNLPSELVEVITEFEMNAPFSVHDIAIDEQGRGYARRVGVERATSEFIAIIDADDIACQDRLSRQLEYFDVNPSTDVVGGYIGEFETDPNETTSVREVPTELEEIKRMAYYRCPINHPTVMFRRDAVLDVGNYREMEYGEDYELWCRLLSNGKELTNIPEILVKVRATEPIASVVTSDRLSLPEVVGNARITVDPTDPDAIDFGIGRVLCHEEFAIRRRERGVERATRLPWDETASTIYDTVIEVSEN